MDDLAADTATIDRRIADRLKALRVERGWSLDTLAERSGVSRSTLSRLENAEVSGTAGVLGRLCTAHGLTLSRLMHLVEEAFQPLVRRESQPVWRDTGAGFRRRIVSPPALALSGEVLEGRLEAGAGVAYDTSPRPGLEHHLVLLEGRLSVTLDGVTHDLRPGDCLRYRLDGASVFAAPADSMARYLLFIV